MKGAMPMTISATLDSSSSPKTMNRIGSTAIGGIIDSTATNGDSGARTSGTRPSRMPKTRPIAALMPTPRPRR